RTAAARIWAPRRSISGALARSFRGLTISREGFTADQRRPNIRSSASCTRETADAIHNIRRSTMQNIWGSRTETGLTADEFREAVELHLTRHIGEPHTAFSDRDGWSGKSKEVGPPIDILVVPPEGERRFAYVCTMGCSLKKSGDARAAGGRVRIEFALAAPQTG